MSPSERIDALVAGEPPQADEQRLARLVYELQTAKPAAPEALRGRVQALAETESARRPTLLERLSLRRALLLLAPAVLIVSVGAAAVQGLVSATSEADEPAALRDMSAEEARPLEGRGVRAPAEPTPGRALRQSLDTANVPPSRERTQDYYAALRLRVDDVDALSAKTQQALRMTRGYGGYVVSVDYGNPRQADGNAMLELRVPIGRVQQAVVAFSELGSIVSQDVKIRDLQAPIDRLTRDIRRLRDRIATLRASLLDPNLTDAERARIEGELAAARGRLAALEQQRRMLVRQGRFAKVSVALTTQTAPAKKEEQGRIERAVDDAGGVLAREVAFGLYALIVASPFLLLTALAIVAARAGRRRADQRLLERA
jgi:Domain of unknown function (DUF4349)